MTALTAIKPTKAEESFRETFEALDGADEGRKTAWKAYADKGLPHKRVEEWKWTDLRGALREARPASVAYAGKIGARAAFAGVEAAEIVFANGRLVNEPDLPQGVSLHRQDEANAPADSDHPVAALARALATDAGAYVLEFDGEPDRPVLLRVLSDGEGAHHLRLAVVVREGAKGRLLEHYHSDGAPYANTLIEVGIADRAELQRDILQTGTDEAVTTVTTLGQAGERAVYGQTALAFGGKLVRLETELTLPKDSAETRMDGAYLLNGRRHADFTSVVDHRGEHCVTRQLVKGAAAGRGNGVFQGRFDVARGAQKTDAQMAHHALLLDEGAQANAKPELMIFADDVQCAHGNTVGALDEAALHYMRSRGLPEAAARALLIEAFIAEAFGGSSDGIREEYIDVSRRWLEKNL